MQVRRVVTGRTSEGKSVIASDELVDPITIAISPGSEFHGLWGSDTIPELPDLGKRPATHDWFPPEEGFRFALVTFPPEGLLQGIDMTVALAEIQRKLPGLAESLEPDFVMHTTNTIDLIFVLSGEIALELDDGAKVQLRAGDSVVQNGTRHAWHNRGSRDCVMAVSMIGARTHRRSDGTLQIGSS
ncbi:MAG: cupin domain-containing protein [Actinomycetota bacterium]|nr:cupin domain-containing protein [Actinomycetota bacterium]